MSRKCAPGEDKENKDKAGVTGKDEAGAMPEQAVKAEDAGTVQKAAGDEDATGPGRDGGE